MAAELAGEKPREMLKAMARVLDGRCGGGTANENGVSGSEKELIRCDI
jgi:hypothetical protein